jgi:hypothetical protein
MTDQPERAKRLTLSQIVEQLLTRGGGERSSVTLTRNATGETQIEVKVRTGDDSEVTTVEAAEAKAAEVYERLRVAYPARPGHDGSSVSLTRNAKGETQIDVEVKTSENGSASTVEQAAAIAATEYETLRGRYPLASGYVGAVSTAERTKPASASKGGKHGE